MEAQGGQMTRRALLLLPFLPFKARSAEVGSEEYSRTLEQFNKHFGVFYRDYFNCPPHATSFDECSKGAFVLNYGEFQKASKLSRIVFPT